MCIETTDVFYPYFFFFCKYTCVAMERALGPSFPVSGSFFHFDAAFPGSYEFYVTSVSLSLIALVRFTLQIQLN